MGGFWLDRDTYISTLAEMAGVKAGLALSRLRLARLVKADGSPWPGRNDPGLHFRSEEFEEVVHLLLFRLGVTHAPRLAEPGIELHHEYRNDQKRLAALHDALELFSKHAAEEMASPNAKSLKLPWFLPMMKGLHGSIGEEVGVRFIAHTNEFLHASPWTRMKSVPYTVRLSLDDLFKKEEATGTREEFFDSRFIRYLNRNFDEIDRIHWRQFEKLSAQYLSDAGFKVTLGPGRDDGGVDLRAVLTLRDGTSFVLLVQCKRVAGYLDTVYLKALHDDVNQENADAGLLVTTSRFTKGHEEVIEQRNHRVDGADRQKVKHWLAEMVRMARPIL